MVSFCKQTSVSSERLIMSLRTKNFKNSTDLLNEVDTGVETVEFFMFAFDTMIDILGEISGEQDTFNAVRHNLNYSLEIQNVKFQYLGDTHEVTIEPTTINGRGTECCSFYFKFDMGLIQKIIDGLISAGRNAQVKFS